MCILNDLPKVGFQGSFTDLRTTVIHSKTSPAFITSTHTRHVLELLNMPKNVLISDLCTVQGSGCWGGCQGGFFHPGRKLPQDLARPGSFCSLKRTEKGREGRRQGCLLEALRAGDKWPLLCEKSSAGRDWDTAAQMKTVHVLETAARPHGGWNPESLGERSPFSLGRVRRAKVDLSGHWLRRFRGGKCLHNVLWKVILFVDHCSLSVRCSEYLDLLCLWS